MDCAWIGVASVYPLSVTARTMDSWSPSSVNFMWFSFLVAGAFVEIPVGSRAIRLPLEIPECQACAFRVRGKQPERVCGAVVLIQQGAVRTIRTTPSDIAQNLRLLQNQLEPESIISMRTAITNQMRIALTPTAGFKIQIDHLGRFER